MNLNQMKKIAKKSDHHRYQHCSLIYAGPRLLAYGYNTVKEHSEIVALRRLSQIYRTKNTQRPKNLHMVNLMIKRRSGSLGNSFPCPRCYNAMLKQGINFVTSFNEKGVPISWRIYQSVFLTPMVKALLTPNGLSQ